MLELVRLRADHGPAVHAFERENRAFFARTVSDRGEEFFRDFARRYDALLREQETGTCASYVLLRSAGRPGGTPAGREGGVLGRFNLYDIGEGTTTVGYRVAQDAVGRGVATAGVRLLCRLAVADHGVRVLMASTSHANAASARVLSKAGFLSVGPAKPEDLGGKDGTTYRLVLPLLSP